MGRQILYHWATWEAFSSQRGFPMLWPERSIQSESQTLGTKFNSRWEKINKGIFRIPALLNLLGWYTENLPFIFPGDCDAQVNLITTDEGHPREIYDEGKGSEEKSKGLRLSARITDTHCLVCFYSEGHLIKCFILLRVGKQHVFSFAQDSGSDVLLCDNLGAIS